MGRGARKVAVALALVMVATVAAGVANGQQSGGGVYQQLLDTLAALQRTTNAVQQSVVAVQENLTTTQQTLYGLQQSMASLQQSIGPVIGANQEASRFTPYVGTAPYANSQVACGATSSATRRIVITMVDTAPHKASVVKQETITLEPGESGGYARQPSTLEDAAYCAFTVLNGTRADFRARIAIRFPNHDYDRLVLAAE